MDLLHLKQDITEDPLAFEIDLEIGRDMLTLPRVVVRERVGVPWLMYGSRIARGRSHQLCGWSFMHCPTLNGNSFTQVIAMDLGLTE